MVLFDILLYFYIGVVNLHQALYRKYRPATFSSVVGQDHITSVLSYEVKENKLNHAYLFCGSRGTGKTSCAKILAKAANCKNTVNGDPCNCCDSCRAIDAGSSLDVLEMDAASNTGVDYIRDIREEVIFTPSQMSTRVYIIDEVHMLSEGAFNALLKTLEEPPANVIFILATTETQKIPATILSRCQRFDFRRITVNDIVSRLNYIAEIENIELEPEAARLIAKLSQGGMRDAISLLELCAGDRSRVDLAIVEDKAGVCGRESVISTVGMIASKNYSGIFESVASVYRSSRDLSVFLSDVLGVYRDMMVIRAMKLTDNRSLDTDVLDVGDGEFAALRELSDKFRYTTMVYHSKLLREAITAMSRGSDKRITAEMTLVRMCSGASGDSAEALSARIDELEDRIAKGALMSQMSAAGLSADNNGKPLQKEEKAQTDQTGRTVSEPWNVKNVPAAESAPAAAPAPASGEEQSGQESVQESEEDGGGEYYNWSELVAAYEKVDAGGAPFLRSAAAYIKGGKLTVCFSDKFAIALLESKKTADKLKLLAKSQGEDIESVSLICNEAKVNKSRQLIDDLI